MRISRWLCGFALLGLSLRAVASPEEASTVEIKTTAVAAFKNGLGFIVRQGEVPLQLGEGRISPLPAPTLGTLWITPNDSGASLEEVVAYRYKESVQRKLDTLSAVLAANAGKTVKLVYEQKEISGEIVALRDKRLPPGDPVGVPYSGMSAPGGDGGALSTPVTPEYLLLKSDGRLMALHLSGVTQATLPSDTNFYQEQQEERKALRFKIKGGGSRASLTLGYLEQGLGWTPSYLISLKGEEAAQITMQAVLVNDAEDLADTSVYFVVGVPNFAYSGTPSPMALQQTLLDFMQSAARRDSAAGSPYSNAIVGQKVLSGLVSSEAMDFTATVEELAGAPEEDLFLYSRSGVTLARGERGSYNVFSDNVGYEHLYEWEVQDQPRVDGFGNVVQPNTYPGSPDSAGLSTIWHSIRLKNSSKFPWTSAPALVTSGTNPVSQDTLPYTPKGASSNLRITIATDLRSSHEERETSRQPNIERRHGYNYDLVTVEGTLKVKNYKTKEIRLSIGKSLRGEVDFLSDAGKAVKLGEAIQTDNPMSRLTWEIDLKAGAEKVITYRYKIWLRV